VKLGDLSSILYDTIRLPHVDLKCVNLDTTDTHIHMEWIGVNHANSVSVLSILNTRCKVSIERHTGTELVYRGELLLVNGAHTRTNQIHIHSQTMKTKEDFKNALRKLISDLIV